MYLFRAWDSPAKAASRFFSVWVPAYLLPLLSGSLLDQFKGGGGLLADGAGLRGAVAFMNISADFTFPFFHRISPFSMNEFASILIGGVKHLFGQCAEGLAVESLVYFFDLRVFVAGTKGHGAVPLIEGGNAALAGLVGVFHQVLGLSAAADAAAGAGHDLHKVVLLAAFLHPLKESAGIGGAVNHRHPQRQIADFDLGFPHPFVAADRGELQQGSGASWPVRYE